MTRRYIILITLAVLLGVYRADTLAGKIYKWVDENGVTHFSDRSPEQPANVKGPVEEGEIKESQPVEPVKGLKTNLPAVNPIVYGTSSTFTIKGARGMGTGFFISPAGYAITCKHVVEGNWDLTAVMNDQREYPVSVISLSPQYDLALLLISMSQENPYIPLRDPRTLIPGERVFAIGTSAGLQATITDGIYSGIRKFKDESAIQFSAPVNQGNSGGPLIDEKGRVVGIVSWKYLKKGDIIIAGVGFALPSSLLPEEYGSYLPENP